MSNKRQEAKSNLIYYMRLLAKSSGVGWDFDNDSEIGGIVDLIIDAAIEEAAIAAEDKANKYVPPPL